MVTHIVFWALKDEAEGHSKRENAEHIKEMLEALVGVVPGLIEAKVGINENGARGAGSGLYPRRGYCRRF